MKMIQFAAIAFLVISSGANAQSWVKTASGQDADANSGPSSHTEFVLPTSIKSLRGNYRTAFVKVTWTPGISTASGDVVTQSISEAMINCGDLSWGHITEMSFDKNMKPVMSDIGEFDKSKDVWTIKNMEKLNPSAITYRTAQYICGIPMNGIGPASSESNQQVLATEVPNAQAGTRSEPFNAAVPSSIKQQLSENVLAHTSAYVMRPAGMVVLTNLDCPKPVPDPKFNGGSVAFLLINGQPGSLPGCYISGPFGGVMLKWANGYGDNVQLSDMHITKLGERYFPK